MHARDVIKKLVDDEVDTKDNFGWTSQLRYYWDGELNTQMVLHQLELESMEQLNVLFLMY